MSRSRIARVLRRVAGAFRMRGVKALVRDRYGGPDVLRVDERPLPRIGARDVLVRVRAASVNAADVDHLRGTVFVRVSGPFRPSVRVLGSDVAGTVESVGAGVTRFMPGDEVFGDLFTSGFGAFAEHARAPESALVAKPAGLTFEQAATLPQAGLLALQGLTDGRPVQPGDTVLINGAGGGAGTFAVQVATSMGARVTGVDSARKSDLLRALGCDDVIDYVEQDFTRTGRHYDRILDFVSRRSPADYRRVMADEGQCLIVGGSTLRLAQAATVGALRSRDSSQNVRLLLWRAMDAADLARLVGLVLAGDVTPVIERTYRLSEAAEALRRTQAGEVLGKAVIVP
jgi:NADPH:quinone reductase-like Zn-dependent oxidoreductase